MTDSYRIVDILVKYALGHPLNETERQLLEAWQSRSAEHRAIPDQLRDPEWRARHQEEIAGDAPSEAMWEDIRRYIEEQAEPEVVGMGSKRRRPAAEDDGMGAKRRRLAAEDDGMGAKRRWLASEVVGMRGRRQRLVAEVVGMGSKRRWLVAAAVVILLAGAGIVTRSLLKGSGEIVQAKKGQAPAAVLVRTDDSSSLLMADGRLIRLDRYPSGEMVWRDGDVIIRKTDSGIEFSGSAISGSRVSEKAITGITHSGLPGPEENRYVLSIGPKARRPFRVDLASGDRIWLNNASQLAYNADLRAGEDPVLDGEALFDIKKDNAFRPLRVRTKKGEVLTVLGTSFAVRSVAGEPQSKVELFSGKVQVKSHQDSVILRPQSAAVIEEGKTLQLVRLERPRAMPVWMRPREKGPTFEFEDTPLAVALQEVADWYLMKLSVPHEVNGAAISGRMKRSESLDNTLRTLEGVEGGRIELQRKGDTIVVLRGKTLSD